MDPLQERRGLCQAPDTRMWLNAQKVDDGTSSIFARKHTVRKVDALPSGLLRLYRGPSGVVGKVLVPPPRTRIQVIQLGSIHFST